MQHSRCCGYAKDSDFAAHVDDALRRILRLKLRLYTGTKAPAATLAASKIPTATLALPAIKPFIPLSDVLTPASSLNVLNPANRQDAAKTMEQVARESTTVLYPDTLPNAPGATDRLLIFSDSRLVRECDQYTTDAALGPDGS